MLKRLLALLALLLSFALLAAACGDDTASEPSDGDGDGEAVDCTADDDDEVKVGLVFDTTGRGDQSFNDSAAAGLDRAETELGITVTAEATPNADGSNRAELLQLAAESSDIVFAVGFAFDETLGEVAVNNPTVCFAGVDTSVFDPPNVLNFKFSEHEGSFLMGVIAALKSETGNVGFIGGVEGELIAKFEAGYNAGATAVNEAAEVQVEYIAPEGDFTGFNAPDRAKEIAAAMYDNGADVIYHAAGGSGLGLFEAAQDAGTLAIGVDSDQWQIATDFQDVILTSMLKPVDAALFQTVESMVDGTFEGGTLVLDLAAGGVGYSTSGGYVDDIADEIAGYEAQVISGEIVVPDVPTS